MKLSMVIVNTNRKKMLFDLLVSIKRYVSSIEHQVIVVDNNSHDGSQEMVKGKFPGVILIALNKNVGLCPAHNIGFKKAKGEYICIFQEDVVIYENTMQCLAEFLDANPDAGYVVPKNIDQNGEISASIEKFITPARDIILAYKHPFSKIYHRFIKKTPRILPKKPKKINWMSITGLFMIRRSILDKIGLFDEDIIVWWSDPFIQLKITRAGWQGYYVPSAKITHYRGLTRKQCDGSSKITSMDELWVYSKYRYFKKFYGFSGLFQVKCNDFIIFYIYLVMYILKYCFVSKDNATKKEINRYIEYFKYVLNLKGRPGLG